LFGWFLRFAVGGRSDAKSICTKLRFERFRDVSVVLSSETYSLNKYRRFYMTLSEIAKRVGKLAQDNSPAILTSIGVVGALSTAFLTGSATYKYMRVLAEEGYYDQDYRFNRTPREHVKEAWKFYVPAGTSLVVTVAAIVFANRIGNRRAAAMAAAYTLSERAFNEYREKVLEKVGKNKEREIRDEVAQDRVTKHPVGSSQVVVTASGNVLCYEAFTGRYFRSGIETLKQAQNTINYRVLNDGYASLGEFYNQIGLPSTAISDELGWRSDGEQLDLIFSAVLAEDGQPAISMEYRVKPIRNYYKFG
jgi:hypothetical protein